jgi:hypothetical protein
MAILNSGPVTAARRLTRKLVVICLAAPLLASGLAQVLQVVIPSQVELVRATTVVAQHTSVLIFVLLPALVLPAALTRLQIRKPGFAFALRRSVLRRDWPGWQAARASVVPAAFATSVALLALWPRGLTLNLHPDESQYVWSAHYYWSHVARGDLTSTTTGPNNDPHWSPLSYWAVTQPMGARFIYGAAIAAMGLDAPSRPYSFDDRLSQGPETEPSERTLLALRRVAALLATAAFGLMGARWGWRGLVPLALLLIPHVPDDLVRAWAEAPLFFGLTLCAVTFRSRWFPYACAVAGTFKLTALALWPVVFFLHPIGRSRFARTFGLLRTSAVWSALTPPSWFAGGPAFLALMAVDRAHEHAVQSEFFGGPLGFFLPSRYALPIELGAALAAVWMLYHVKAISGALPGDGRLARAWRNIGSALGAVRWDAGANV